MGLKEVNAGFLGKFLPFGWFKALFQVGRDVATGLSGFGMLF
jgi:hypothetical protein